MRRSRCLIVNWKALDGAAYSKRQLILRKNDKCLYTCPAKLCLHADYKSSRGLRKHIDNKHPWYYYFDEQPEVKREEMSEPPIIKKRASTSSKPAFSLEDGIGKLFLDWLCTSCGGGKSEKEARQTGRRVMKFFQKALGNNDNNMELNYEFVDCCLSSPSIVIEFLTTLEEEWKLSSSASLNYVKAISDFVDFRKAHKVTDNTLRCFTVVEVYLRRGMVNLRKKKNLECKRNLSLEALIARDSWATIEEMEAVIPFHMKTFKCVINKCNDESSMSPVKSDLVFCVRFITTLLFLRVKCSRPMTFQYLTMEMFEKAKTNGGFVEQTEFKTSSKYIFDTLVISEDVIEIINLYISHVRPRLHPKCDYLLLSTNGTQYQSLTTAMTMIVHQAIGKYVNPTRYRQIIETESSERLTLEEQNVVSEDQKHSSRVAKIFYKKKQSRKVAIEGKKCIEKMVNRDDSHNNLVNMFNNAEYDFNPNVLQRSANIIQGIELNNDNDDDDYDSDVSIVEEDPYQPMNESIDGVTANTVVTNENLLSCASKNYNVPNNILTQKEVILNVATNKLNKNVKFTMEEDGYLKEGIKKYGRSAWALILKDKCFKFHKSRNRDSLRVRANSIAFKKMFDRNV